MKNAVNETSKRLELAKKQLERFRKKSLGIILVGSVAHSPNLNVNEYSDLDLIIIVERLKEILPLVVKDEKEIKCLRNRFFEGYCLKDKENNIPISIHILSKDAFEIISRCFVADIRVYRPYSKTGFYKLNGFDGNGYEYHIKNISLRDLKGVRTIVPISFINNDRYFIGIHRDKLLSNPITIYERGRYISKGIDKLWEVVAENLRDESIRLYGKINLGRMNILNALAKNNQMCPEIREAVKDKTRFYLSKIR